MIFAAQFASAVERLRPGRTSGKRLLCSEVRRPLLVALFVMACGEAASAQGAGLLDGRGSSTLLGQADAASAQNGARGGRCPNIVGTWQSWASLLFGQGDTTFNADGTAMHRSGIAATWKCRGDRIEMSWGGASPELFTLEGNQLINSHGVVGFSRLEGQAPPSASAPEPKRPRARIVKQARLPPSPPAPAKTPAPAKAPASAERRCVNTKECEAFRWGF